MLFDVHYFVKDLYKPLFCLRLILLIFMPSFYILSTAAGIDAVHFCFFLSLTFVIQLIPVYLAVRIVTGFNIIHCILNNSYHLNRSSNEIQAMFKRWLYECGHREVAFDCGYFTMGFSFLSIAVNVSST